MQEADFLIIGSGIAGLRAAIEVEARARVVVLTKSRTDESNTEYAQGGIAAAMSDEDEIGLHYQDTMGAGDGLCHEAAVRCLVEEGPLRIQELIDWGTEFDREGLKLAFTREAAHSRKRILHAQGDSTGREISRTLQRKVESFKNIRILPFSLALELLVGEEGCEGVRFLEEKTGKVREIRCRALLLASGGLGMVYRETTNPAIATGDGYSLAFAAGAALMDMEFVQFHPTALQLPGAPHFLLSEALRGEGAVLRNTRGERFMHRYHRLAELAPRDVVARSLFQETQQTASDRVFLDLTHLAPSFLQSRFPRIYRTCLELGLDISREWIPVFPAAHYMMGGVYTDLHGRTTLPGLLAAGEVACNGVHGANRLASNSLLEGLVYGARAGRALLGKAPPLSLEPGLQLAREAWTRKYDRESVQTRQSRIRSLLSEKVGIVRSADGLQAACCELDRIPFSSQLSRDGQEFNSLLCNARLIARAALLRCESRGAHYRVDWPHRDDKNWRRHLLVRFDAAAGQVIYQTWHGVEAEAPAGVG